MNKKPLKSISWSRPQKKEERKKRKKRIYLKDLSQCRIYLSRLIWEFECEEITAYKLDTLRKAIETLSRIISSGDLENRVKQLEKLLNESS